VLNVDHDAVSEAGLLATRRALETSRTLPEIVAACNYRDQVEMIARRFLPRAADCARVPDATQHQVGVQL
jgi:hypothetical protein